MASNLKIAHNTAQLQAQALLTILNGSLVNIYSGVQPATPETALSSNVLLATIALPAASAFGASNGILTAAAITSVTVTNTGTATFFRWTDSTGATVLMDGSVGMTVADLIISSTYLIRGAIINTTSFTFTIPST